MARYGLRVELGVEVEKLSLLPEPDAARFNPVNDSDLAHELAEREPGVVWITKQALWPKYRRASSNSATARWRRERRTTAG
ncbi:MAG: hypothetical protein U1F20_09110 [Lysobacterales bacterium]